MAHSQNYSRFRNLRLDTNADEQRRRGSEIAKYREEEDVNGRPLFRHSATSQETLRAAGTPPIEIPRAYGDDVAVESPTPLEGQDGSFMEHYMRHKSTPVQAVKEVTVESQHRMSMPEPIQNSGSSVRSRGRSNLCDKAIPAQRPGRAHSESERSHYDPTTGRHLPRYSTTPPRDEPHIGEKRFPLLQSTVDDMARESRRHQSHTMSMTSASTISQPAEEPRTPHDDESVNASSPIQIPSPFRPSSYEPNPRFSARKASQRWRDGEAAQDFFSRAGSMRRGTTRRATRRDTASSTKSPSSAASSFLRGFSTSNGADDASAPIAVDAEGQTIGDDYVLGKQIGFGGFSVVKEVTQMSAQTGKQRKLAVKIIRKVLDGLSETENEAAQSEFEHEVELWRLLSHRHILPLEAVYKLDEATFCFVPLNVGGTLFDLVRMNRKGIPLELARNYSYQLASALRYLHLDARVVHRDVKLENVLLDTSQGTPGAIRLCDFGMAEWLSNDSSSTPTSDGYDVSNLHSKLNLTSNHNLDPNFDGNRSNGSSISSSVSASTGNDRTLRRYFGPAETSSSAFAGGSLEYAAPEILRIATSSSGMVSRETLPPERSIVSPAVDIWAFGVCLFSLIMGARPFSSHFQPKVLMAILAGDWDRANLRLRGGADASAIIEACLGMKARDRAAISEVMDMDWFDQVRDLFDAEDEDEDSNDGKRNVWRL